MSYKPADLVDILDTSGVAHTLSSRRGLSGINMCRNNGVPLRLEPRMIPVEPEQGRDFRVAARESVVLFVFNP